MKHFAIFLIASGLLVFVFGCGPGPPKAKLDAEDQFLLAKQKFDNRKYFDAQTEFQKLIWNFPGSDYVDEAQYYLAECFFGQEDYQSAIHEYTRLLRNYSQSPFVDDAQYKVGVSYYKQSLPAPLDQDDTQKAARALQTFLDDYPNSEYVSEAKKYLLSARTRLSKKEYLNGQLYYKMGAYDSAIIYFEELLKNYSDTKWADDAQYAIGECQHRQKKWEQALQSYQKVLEMSSSKKVVQRAQKRIDKIEKELAEAPKASE